MILSKVEFPEVVKKLNHEVCVSIFTYARHNKIIINNLKQLSNLYRIVSYNYSEIPPNPEIFKLCESFITTHQTLKNVNTPWFWHMKNCFPILEARKFKYVLFICGDTYVGNPYNISKLPEIMGDHDLMSYAYSEKAVGTFTWFIKTEALKRMVNQMDKVWYKHPVSAVGIKFRRFIIKQANLKLQEYNKMNKHMFSLKRNNKQKSFLTEYLDLKHIIRGDEI